MGASKTVLIEMGLQKVSIFSILRNTYFVMQIPLTHVWHDLFYLAES